MKSFFIVIMTVNAISPPPRLDKRAVCYLKGHIWWSVSQTHVLYKTASFIPPYHHRAVGMPSPPSCFTGNQRPSEGNHLVQYQGAGGRGWIMVIIYKLKHNCW